jgi:diacylglycerol O-acyltransferase
MGPFAPAVTTPSGAPWASQSCGEATIVMDRTGRTESSGRAVDMTGGHGVPGDTTRIPGADRMAAADAILWRIEHDPVLRSTVTSVSRLDRSPDPKRLRRRIENMVVEVPRMRQVVAEPPLGVGTPHWRPAPDFDLDYHLRRVRLAGHARFDEVLDFAARQAMAGFDRVRPLWEFTVVEDVEGGAAWIQRFHHAVTDGLGGMQLALGMLDLDRPGQHPAEHSALAGEGGSAEGHRSGTVGSTSPGRPGAGAGVRARGNGLDRAVALPWLVGSAALRVGRRPARALAELAGTVRWGARLLAPVSSPLSPIMRARSTRLAFAAFDVDLLRLHAAARAVACSLNDAFVTAVGTGLGRYHEALGHPVTRLRVTLPMSIRRLGDPLTGNRFTPVRFEVPVAPPDPATLVPVVASLVRQWRQGPALGLSDALAIPLSTLPTPLLAGVFGSLLRNVDFVATNVPGLQAPSYVAGARVVRQYAFAPPSGAALNVAMLSHGGHCCIGVNMDPAAIGDPELLVRSLRQGFNEVLALVPAAPAAPEGVEG